MGTESDPTPFNRGDDRPGTAQTPNPLRDVRAPAPAPAARKARRSAGLVALYVAIFVQAMSALFFVGDLWSEVLGLRRFTIPWDVQELIQVFASLGLTIGVVISALFVRRTRLEMDRMRRQIDVAAGNFEFHLDNVFDEWGLSRSEQDVAIYAMKGFSNTEIAELRGTSASTIKSQMNAIYRKAGLSNRQQLISCLVEDLMSGVAAEERAA